MAKFIGRKVAVGLGNESTRLTGVAPDFWLPQTDLSFTEKAQEVRSTAGFNQIADTEGREIVETWTEGNIAGEIRSESFGLILKALSGADPSTGGSYTHTYTLQDNNQHGTLTVVLQDPIGDQMFKGAMLNTLTIEQSLDSFAMFNANFMAKAPVATSQTPSYSDETKFTKSHLEVKLADVLANLTAATALNTVESLTLNIEKNATRDSVVGTAEPIDFLNFAFSVSGSMVLKYENRTYRDYMLNDTNRAMELKWTNGDDILTFRFPLVDFMWETDYALDEVVRQTVNFKCNYDLVNGNNVISTITLANDTSSY